eukprot:1140097-Pelagomonas_calceolata.AAC.1
MTAVGRHLNKCPVVSILLHGGIKSANTKLQGSMTLQELLMISAPGNECGSWFMLLAVPQLV